ncbi:MAG: SAM-dependent methyltransferase [Psychroserpens sp.]|jgi:SAM-dependent methyltransferase
MTLPSKFDNDTFEMAREHLNSFISRCAKKINRDNLKLLEIGPQTRSEIQRNFNNCTIDTLDIVSDYNPDILGDITKYNEHIEDSKYDIVTCLEILEHTVNPFKAIEELRRILKHEGYLLLSAPLNWRIHGPIPDCWRITEFGWKVLLKDFEILEIDKLETPDRNLFPIKYNILVKCDKIKNVDLDKVEFGLVD